MEIKDFTNHSGGASGADLEWDAIGRKHGFETHIHWRPEHLKNLTPEGHKNMLRSYLDAAEALCRPQIFKSMELCQRDWIPAFHAEAIYAISYILEPGQKDTLGRENKADKQVVAGGTGWAVQMAIQMGKPVWVFDMNHNRWCKWDPGSNQFLVLREDIIPLLTEIFSGIGARVITPQGMKAIDEVYKKTKEQCLTLGTQKPLKD